MFVQLTMQPSTTKKGGFKDLLTLDIVLILCVHIAQSFNAQDEIKGIEVI